MWLQQSKARFGGSHFDSSDSHPDCHLVNCHTKLVSESGYSAMLWWIVRQCENKKSLKSTLYPVRFLAQYNAPRNEGLDFVDFSNLPLQTSKMHSAPRQCWVGRLVTHCAKDQQIATLSICTRVSWGQSHKCANILYSDDTKCSWKSNIEVY